MWHLQVLGFVVDMKTLGKITFAVGSFFATVVPVVVALSRTGGQREESVADSESSQQQHAA